MRMSQEEFDGWVATAMEAFADAPVEDDPAVLFCTNEARTFLGQTMGEYAIVHSFTTDDFQQTGGQAVNRMLLDGPPRKVAAMATRALWSPNDDEPTVDAWLATVVAPERAAVFAVKRWVQDKLWWRLDPKDAPWLILSCASGLRKALTSAEPLTLKVARDRRLFNRIDEEPPPTDEHGRI